MTSFDQSEGPNLRVAKLYAENIFTGSGPGLLVTTGIMELNSGILKVCQTNESVGSCAPTHAA